MNLTIEQILEQTGNFTRVIVSKENYTALTEKQIVGDKNVDVLPYKLVETSRKDLYVKAKELNGVTVICAYDPKLKRPNGKLGSQVFKIKTSDLSNPNVTLDIKERAERVNYDGLVF